MIDDTKQHLINSLNQGIRLDGRKLDEFRKIEVECGISGTAEGSARVKIGDTEVLAGVKMLIGAPFPDTPEDGALMVNAEFLPMSNPEFESGPPGIDSIELARIVDRGIRESKAIDLKKLCVKKGEKCWIVSIDVITINDDGNLLDAAALASLLAIKDTKFPKYEDDELDYSVKTDKELPILRLPVSVTVTKIGNNFLVDPTIEEKKMIDARLTVATTPDDVICALQKGGSEPLSIEDISKMIDLAAEKAKYLRKFL